MVVQVVLVLDFLTDKALGAKRFRVMEPVYAAADEMDAAGIDEDDDNLSGVRALTVGFEI